MRVRNRQHLDSSVASRVTDLHAWGVERGRLAVSIDLADLKALLCAAGVR